METVKPLLNHDSFTGMLEQLKTAHFKKAAELDYEDIVITHSNLNSIYMWFDATEVRLLACFTREIYPIRYV